MTSSDVGRRSTVDAALREPAPLAWRRRTAVEMLVSGLIGLVASFVLSVEALTIAADPTARLGCDVSDVVSGCSSSRSSTSAPCARGACW